jgi:hypothetical protein
VTFRKPIAGRTFEPDNAALVSTSTAKQGVTNADYRSELEAYRNDKAIAAIMRERTSVCGRG